MADSHFTPPKTVRSGEIIRAADFNTNNEALKTAFNAIGAPLPATAPSGEKGVNTPFWCLAPTRDEHAVTLGYLNANYSTYLDSSVAKAAQWAEEAEDVEVETGQYSAKHWASKAETTVADYINLAGAVPNVTYNDYVAKKERVLTFITASTAVPSDKYISHFVIDATGGAVTLTLPAAPLEGQIVSYQDSKGLFSTNNLTIARNGKNIQGVAEDFTDDREFGSACLAYDSTNGWIFTAISYAAEF